MSDIKDYLGFVKRLPRDREEVMREGAERTPEELAEMFMNPHAPKTEAEHWAVREIERLRAEVERLRADAERFRWIAGQKRLYLYTDGGTWTRADGTTFRAWGVLAANGVGYPPAETLAELVDLARKDQEDGR